MVDETAGAAPSTKLPFQERCENCRFWLVAETHWETGAVINGRCRRQAPIREATDSYPGHQAVWPVTGPSAWCGEWQPTEEAVQDWVLAQRGKITAAIGGGS